VKWCFLLWYFQDLLQIFGEGYLYAPELFLAAVLLLMSSGNYDHPGLIWFSFLGGVLWDARWTGLIGMTAGTYAVLTTFFSFLWSSMPDTGRNKLAFFAFLGGAHVAVGMVRCLLVMSLQDMSWIFFLRQQILGIPLMYMITRMAFPREGMYGAP